MAKVLATITVSFSKVVDISGVPGVPGGPTDPDYGIDEGAEPGQGLPEHPGHHPSRPSKEQILEMLKEHEEQIRAKIDEIRDAVADRIPGVKEKLEAIKAEIAAKIEEIKSRPVDPGYGVEGGAPGQGLPGEGAPGQGLPDRLEAFKETISAKLEAIKVEVADRIPGIKEKIDIAKRVLADAIEDLIHKIQGGDCAAKIAGIKAAVQAKLDALKQELAGRGADIAAKIDAAKSALADKIEEVKNRPVDPGYGVDAPERTPKPSRRRITH
jgi:DNA repair exonuclease SbcCD ATPase subunit